VREFDESVVVIERKWGAEPEYLHCDVKVLLVYVVRGGKTRVKPSGAASLTVLRRRLIPRRRSASDTV
jgi:hypothetical protein